MSEDAIKYQQKEDLSNNCPRCESKRRAIITHPEDPFSQIMCLSCGFGVSKETGKPPIRNWSDGLNCLIDQKVKLLETLKDKIAALRELQVSRNCNQIKQ